MNIRNRLLSRPGFFYVMFAPEGGAGAGGAGAGGAAAAGADGAAGGAAAGADGADGAAGGGTGTQGYRPDGLSEDLAGGNDQETIDKLHGALKAATTVGEAGDYVVKWEGDNAEALTGAFGNPDDPLYSAAREAAVKHGIPPKAFAGLMTDVFGPALANGILPPPFNPAAEAEAFGKSIGVTDKTQLGREIADRQQWATGIGKQLGLTDGGQLALDVLTDSADGLEVIDKLRTIMSAEGIKVEGSSTPSGPGLGKDELHALDSDPRIDPASPKFDQALRNKYDAGYKRHYG